MTKCTECKYSYLKDTGYSNYTVMGTDFSCLQKKHPDDNFDVFYGEDKRLDFAKKCGSFTSGPGLEIDCDFELGDVDQYTNDPEIVALFNDQS